MRTKIISALGLIAIGFMYYGSLTGKAESVPAKRAATAGTPPIGLLVEIREVIWPFSTTEMAKIEGTLVEMNDEWIVVASGSTETWVPKDKVMTMKATR